MKAKTVPNCPKALKSCPEGACPEYPCWALDQHLNQMDREKRAKDDGWE